MTGGRTPVGEGTVEALGVHSRTGEALGRAAAVSLRRGLPRRHYYLIIAGMQGGKGVPEDDRRRTDANIYRHVKFSEYFRYY